MFDLFGDRLTRRAPLFKVKGDRLLGVLDRRGQGVSLTDTARQRGHRDPVSALFGIWVQDDGVTMPRRLLQSRFRRSSAESPAWSRIDVSTAGGMVLPVCTGTVTCPGLDGWRNCRWLPR
jgi:hypothetical protein